MRLIDADALKSELAPQDDWTWANGAYVRDMIDAVPTIDAIPVALLDKYKNEQMLKTPIYLIRNIWQHERDKHIDGGENDETY